MTFRHKGTGSHRAVPYHCLAQLAPPSADHENCVGQELWYRSANAIHLWRDQFFSDRARLCPRNACDQKEQSRGERFALLLISCRMQPVAACVGYTPSDRSYTLSARLA